MGREAFSELRSIRNQIAHGLLPPNALLDRLGQLGIHVPPENISTFARTLLSLFSSPAGYRTPPPVLQVLSKLLEGRSPNVVCDPWAGLGEVLSSVCEITRAPKAYAITQSQDEYTLGRILVPRAEWKLGSPLLALQAITTEIDVAASVLPFGAKSSEPLTLMRKDGTPVELQDDLGHLILTATASRLSESGLGLFIVPAIFFSSARSVLRELPALGLSVEAALSLPSGSFAPYTNMPTYLVAVSKRNVSRMFVAELSNDAVTNGQIIENFKEGKEGGRLELGRFVAPASFTGLDQLRLAERLDQAASQFGSPSLQLGELATVINLGRPTDGFEFPRHQNAIFIPLIGNSDVVESLHELTLKGQNYAQIAIDPARSNARFVARFLNSELGNDIRELNKSGTVIPKLNKQTLANITIFVPDLRTPKIMLQTETNIAAEQNTLLGLQNELGALQRQLWTNPRSVSDVDKHLSALSSRLSGSLQEHAAEGLDQWCEGLPFPLASICRVWQATASDDFRSKHEHLLHLFEATAEFVSVILLTAFSSNESLFAPHKQKMTEEMLRQNFSLKRATFGTWKLVVEYLGKQTRLLLAGDKDSKSVCGDLFPDLSLELPQALSRKELAAILSATNKMRNDWSGHGGVVGQDEARLRNEQLVGELQKLRETFAELWSNVQLLHALHCRPRRGLFDNEVSVLMGSNSEFLMETRPMATWLDVERLYLCHKESALALKLLPLVQVGPSPQSAKNACYFFSRLERDGGARFISYHFIDKPELTGQFDQAALEAIKLLTDP